MSKYQFNLQTITLATAVFAGTGCALPAQASYDWLNWQPQVGGIHARENAIEGEFISDYKDGYINSLELANFRRDLDGIRVQENVYRIDEQGLNQKGKGSIMGKLDQIQDGLDAACGDKFCSIKAASNHNHVPGM